MMTSAAMPTDRRPVEPSQRANGAAPVASSDGSGSVRPKLGCLRSSGVLGQRERMDVMSDANADRPWLLDLATPQRGSADAVDGAAYDDTRQMTYLQEPNVPVIGSGRSAPTKKADREVGEDQKGW